MVSYDTMEVSATQSPKHKVEQFLADMRLSMATKPFVPINRQKNKDTLAQLGITWKDAKEYIRNMVYQNYVSGPDPDYDPNEPDPVWKFKIRIGNDIIYVKIKICYASNGEVKALSFHFDNM